MKKIIKPENLKILIPAAGILGALLQVILYLTGIDEKGLLVRWHWAGVLTWALTLAVAATVFLGCRKLRGSRHYKRCYPASVPGGIGCFFCSAGFLLTGLSHRHAAESMLDTAAAVLCFGSAAAMIWVGICRIRRKKPYFLCHAVVSLCFALLMVGQYRVRSSDPQLMDYCFYMTALVMLMLTGYQMAAFDAGIGNHRKLWMSALGAVYLCLVGAYNSGNALFMVSCAVWALTNLTNLKLRRRAVQPPAQEGA